MISSEQISPREHFLLDNENEQNRLSREHALAISRLSLEAKKVELRLKQDERIAARKHQQQMKELELAIREKEVQWGQLLRLPLLIIKLPVLILLGIAYICAVLTHQDINNTEFWRYLR